MTTIVFYIFLLFTAVSAISVALTRDLVYAALRLFLTLLGVAGIFVFCRAEFLAISQLFVYIGGVLILLVFGIMLTRKTENQNPHSTLVQPIMGGIVSLGVLGIILSVIYHIPNSILAAQSTPLSSINNTQLIGTQTLTAYLLPFELISVLLLVALIGAAFIARKT